MPPTPLQTYLAERLQSARGLGWPMPESLPEASRAKPEPKPAFAWPQLWAAWLRLVR